MKNVNDLRLVYVSTNSYENAIHISRILISEKLAACCSISQNQTAIYDWENSIEERIECLIIMKTTSDKLDILETRIKELHSDKVPEIISVVVDSVSEPYQNWLNSVLK